MQKEMSSREFFGYTVKILSEQAQNKDFIDEELVTIPQIVDSGKNYVLKWMEDEEFKATFKGNTTGYYLAMCANCIGGGMMYASAWADSENAIGSLKYDDLYDGSVWENIFTLAEMKNDNEKTEFQKFIILLFETWVKSVTEYLKKPNAGEYLIESFNAFFVVGAGIKFCSLGY